MIDYMTRSIWRKLAGSRLSPDLSDATLILKKDQVLFRYLPVAAYLLERMNQPRRSLVAIAGPPGSGKTSFSLILAAVINAIHPHMAVVVGQDGWHFPNRYLSSHSIFRHGEPILLSEIKGAPETFDVDGFTSFLQQVRIQPHLTFPIYSRTLHEPVSGAGAIFPDHRLILVEGNYLLLDLPPWKELHSLFNHTIFIRAPLNTLLTSLRARHLHGGKSLERTENHLHRVDLPNIQIVQQASIPAEILVEKADPAIISRVVFQRAAFSQPENAPFPGGK